MQAQDVLKYLKIIQKWWWVIFLLVGTTASTMLAILYLTEAEYEATTTLQVSAPPPQEVPLYSQFGRQALRDEIAQTQTSFGEFLMEGDAAWRVLETLPDIPMTGRELRDKMIVEVPDNSQLVYVRIHAPEPEMSALLANTLVEIGLRGYGQFLANPTASTRDFIDQELEVARTELSAAEVELAQFRIDNKVGDLNEAINGQYNLIKSLRIQSDLARAEGEVAKAQSIDEAILEREAELQNMIGASARYNELVDRVDRARSTYTFLLDKQTESRIKENQILELGSIQVITPARVPQQPLSAISPRLVILGVIASLMAGVLLTFLLEYLEMSGIFRGLQKRSELSDVAVLSDHIG